LGAALRFRAGVTALNRDFEADNLVFTTACNLRFLGIRFFGIDEEPPAGGDSLSRTLGSPRHRALVELVIAERKAAGLTQVQVARKLRRYQSYVTLLETGQRRLDVVEFMDIADAIGFDAPAAIKRLYRIPKK
jgi:Helix-turn-helix domain